MQLNDNFFEKSTGERNCDCLPFSNHLTVVIVSAKNAEKLLMKGNTVIVDIKTSRFKSAFGVRELFQSFLGMIPRELVKRQQESVKKNNTRLWAELKPNLEVMKPKLLANGVDSEGKDFVERIMKFSFLDERAYFVSNDGSKSEIEEPIDY